MEVPKGVKPNPIGDRRSAYAVRVALLGLEGPTGTFTHANLGTIPW
jgi:hypothetical protein